jgi:hypothetical protein
MDALPSSASPVDRAMVPGLNHEVGGAPDRRLSNRGGALGCRHEKLGEAEAIAETVLVA